MAFDLERFERHWRRQRTVAQGLRGAGARSKERREEARELLRGATLRAPADDRGR